MSDVVVHLPPPMHARAFQMMLARAKELDDDGESVILTHCGQQGGTCFANLTGSRWVCRACQSSTRKTTEDLGMELVTLDLPGSTRAESGISQGDKKQLLEGVNSTLITLIRVIKRDLRRLPLLRAIKRRNFLTAAGLLRSLNALLNRRDVHRIEVENGRFACTKFGLVAAWNRDLDYNTLDFSYGSYPMVFRGHTPHDRAAIQVRVRRNPVDEEIARQYYEGRQDSRQNVFARKHKHANLPTPPEGTEKRVSFFLSSQDECESLGPEWRSPFRDTAEVVRQACLAYSQYYFCVRFHPNQAKILSDITSDYRKLEDLSNLHIFYPHDEVNTYRIVDWSDVVVTFASTVAIEACWSGKAVVQLGPSFFDQLGISYTPETTEEFLQLLGTDLQQWPREAAIQYGHYDLKDYDTLRFLDYSNGEAQPVGFERRGGVMATSAKKANNLANKLLKKFIGLRIPRSRKAA